MTDSCPFDVTEFCVCATKLSLDTSDLSGGKDTVETSAAICFACRFFDFFSFLLLSQSMIFMCALVTLLMSKSATSQQIHKIPCF